MQFKCDALVLRTVNYGESDKIVTLLSPAGKLTAGMKGVRKAGAKLRFAAQPFCFAEYVFAGKGNRLTVTGASMHSCFFTVCENLRAYFAGNVVVEACDKLSYEELESGQLLLSALKALKELALLTKESPNEQTYRILIEFLLEALHFAGYDADPAHFQSADAKRDLSRLGTYFESKIDSPLLTLKSLFQLG